MTRAVRERILKDVNGNVNDHLRNHIHLTNCIHLKNHMHKHSPIIADRALIRDIVALQRSRSLRDPPASSHSWHSPSTVDALLKRAEKDESVNGRRSFSLERPRMSGGSPQQSSKDGRRRRGKREEGSHTVSRSSESKDRKVKRQDLHLNPLSEQLQDVGDESDHVTLSCNHEKQSQVEKSSEEGGGNVKSHYSNSNNNNNNNNNNNKNSRAKRRRFRGSRRPCPSSITKREAEVHTEISVASNSSSGENRDNFNSGPQNGCGIHWNWSRIHDRGKLILDLAGRSISCGMSESRLRKTGSNMPDMSQHWSSSAKSDGQEALPLLLYGSHGSGECGPTWFLNFSGELSLYNADKLLRSEGDSDLSSKVRSFEQQHEKYNNRRHQNITQKYMPRTFKDLVGQNLVVEALLNAITKRKVGPLYLFHGPHGTGKTSCARIFAQALNCHSLEHPQPCGLCSSCARARNVREIGPVSNVDFDSLIEILDNAVGPRVRSRCRVLIFDECDTLSYECWSAILKAIDRAGSRAVFILICSRFEDLPHMIISRCQKFFFPKLKDADIIYTLQWISTKEDLKIDKDALKLIASRSDGSLRDAEMTLEQLSLLGKRISLDLVQEFVGLISVEKLVDLLDLALSADTVNTVKNLRDIIEYGVEPLALMSQLATVITDILAGSYDFTNEGSRRKFFRRNTLSKEDAEKLRQALKTLSEAEKQLRASNDRITWLTAALLQLAPDQQYMLPTSSADTSYRHSPLGKPSKTNTEKLKGVAINGNGHDRIRAANAQLPGVFRKEIEKIWMQVLEKIPIESVREFMCREGKLISVSYGAAPTVQLLFTSQLTKSKAEKFRAQVLQAFESVLKSPLIIEIRCGPDPGTIVGPTTGDDDARRLGNRDAGPSVTEIVEVEESPRETTRERAGFSKSSEKISSLLGGGNRSLSMVRSKVSLAHVIQRAEGASQHGGWSRRKAVSIAEKLEQENLRLEPRSRRLVCCNPRKATRRKLSGLKIRTRKPEILLKYMACGRCLYGGSPMRR